MELTKHGAAQLDDFAIDLAWAPGGDLLAAASASGPIGIFDPTGNRRHELRGHEDGTNCLGFAPGSPGLLASGGQDGAVRFWDAALGQHAATAEIGRGWVEHLAWRESLLAAACGKKVVILGADGAVRQGLPESSKTVSALAWDPARTILADACFGAVRLWDAAGGKLQKEFPYGNGIQALVWSPDGGWLVSGNQDPSVHLWHIADDTELQMSGYEGKVRHLSFDPKGRWLATSGGNDACLWDCSGPGPEGREPAMLPHEAPVCALRYQNGHGLLATGSKDGAVKLWSPERQQPLRASVQLPGEPTALAWSPDDQYLAIGSNQGTIYILRCAT